MEISHILFDLDNTLYQASNGLFDEIARRMTAFVARHFNITQAAALAVRQAYGQKYGTTLGGLVTEGGLADPETFLHEVHPVNVGDYVKQDPRLRPMLISLPYPKSIFTNSPLEHALRILEYLEIRSCFENIFDIRFCDFIGKPVKSAYEKVLAKLMIKPEAALLVDDLPHYLAVYQAMGGPVVQVKEDGAGTTRFPFIRDVKELPRFLQSRQD